MFDRSQTYAYSHKHHSSVLNDITDGMRNVTGGRPQLSSEFVKKPAFFRTVERDTTLGVGILQQGDNHSVSEIFVIQTDV